VIGLQWIKLCNGKRKTFSSGLASHDENSQERATASHDPIMMYLLWQLAFGWLAGLHLNARELAYPPAFAPWNFTSRFEPHGDESSSFTTEHTE
jgi:hypothetical protein